jgi:hypothetical protein
MQDVEKKRNQAERLLAALEWLDDAERRAFEDMIIGAATLNKIVALRAIKTGKSA